MSESLEANFQTLYMWQQAMPIVQDNRLCRLYAGNLIFHAPPRRKTLRSGGKAENLNFRPRDLCLRVAWHKFVMRKKATQKWGQR